MNYSAINTNANDNECSLDILTSVYIPRVYGNIPVDFIHEAFEDLNLGVVNNVQIVSRPGNSSYMAFVYFESWNTDNPAAVNLARKINNPNVQARIVYDDPWFWILLPNTSKPVVKEETKTDEKENDEIISCVMDVIDELEREEEFNVLRLMVEDLQERLRDSEKKQAIIQNEVAHLRSVVVGSDLLPPPPLKLTRQSATIISSPPIRIDNFMRDTIKKHIVAGDIVPPPPSPQEVNWWPTEEEIAVEKNIAEYRENRLKRRMEEAGIEVDTDLTEIRHPDKEVNWNLTEEEIASGLDINDNVWRDEEGFWREDEIKQRKQVRVDDLGLVYPDGDNGCFWCDN